MGRQDTALDATGPINQNRNIKLIPPLYLVNYVAPLTSQVEELEQICTITTISSSPAQPTMNNHKMPNSHRPSSRPRSRSCIHFSTPIDTSAHTTTVSKPSNKHAPIAPSPTPLHPPTRIFAQSYWKHAKRKRATTKRETQYTKQQ